ncbi:MAG: protein-ADP-ribose hydrolase [Bacteroidales bacterium]|nr:protein-ADP-ribose hydrolase [Bacteroidales bacterium]
MTENGTADLDYVMQVLLEEQNDYSYVVIPEDIAEKRHLMHSLMNVRQPLPVSGHFLQAQDAELGRQLMEKVVVQAGQIQRLSLDPQLKLWQGDITRLEVDAIVNAANSQMLGCFIPLHTCIDNAIHSAADIQLRLECHNLLKVQGHPEPAGSAWITKGYNLPASHVIHTVEPVISNGRVTHQDESLLADCYRMCLSKANENRLKSIAFCCISTGEYRFPNQKAAEIATNTVRGFFRQHQNTVVETVIFNVFKDLDYDIYRKLLQPEK